jgi:hypothetical protein
MIQDRRHVATDLVLGHDNGWAAPTIRGGRHSAQSANSQRKTSTSQRSTRISSHRANFSGNPPIGSSRYDVYVVTAQRLSLYVSIRLDGYSALGTFPNNVFKPSVMVGCVRMASRITV